MPGGNLFILFAPHIGVSDSGELGKYTRKGQVGHDGTACGAACGALKYCEDCKMKADAGEVEVKEVKKLGEMYADYQEEFIIAQVTWRVCDSCASLSDMPNNYTLFGICNSVH